VVFSARLGSDSCAETEQLIREVAECSDQVSIEILNLHIDRERAQAYGVERVPAVVVEGARDYGVRFFGLPGGYEFSNLIDAMVAVSAGVPQLTAATLERLAALTTPLHIQVFATPT
jgi:alkyl hydroperoxide reductase subunit AhpF